MTDLECLLNTCVTPELCADRCALCADTDAKVLRETARHEARARRRGDWGTEGEHSQSEAERRAEQNSAGQK